MGERFEAGHIPADAFHLFYSRTCKVPGKVARHPEYEIFYHIHGPITFEIEGESYHLHPGDFLLLPPGTEHRAVGEPQPEDAPYESILMKIKPTFLDELIPPYEGIRKLADCFSKRETGYLLRPSRNQCRNSLDLLRRILMLQNSDADYYGRSTSMSSILVLFLINLYYLDAESRVSQPIPGRNLVESVQAYIDQNYASSLNLDRLAELFFVSKYHLLHEFSRSTGTSVHHYIIQRRLRAVCSLLEQNVPPSEAYQLCGFKDYTSFYRSFRNAFGQSPREYLQAHQKQTELK